MELTVLEDTIIPTILVNDQNLTETPESHDLPSTFDCSWAGKHEGPRQLRMALELIGGTDDEPADIRLRNSLAVVQYAYESYARNNNALLSADGCMTLAISPADFVPILYRISRESTFKKFDLLIEDTLATLANLSELPAPDKHFRLTWANEQCTVAVTCIIPDCKELVNDVFSTTDASFDNGFTILDVEDRTIHMEGLCHKHRCDAYTNQCLNWIAEWNSIDAEYIQQRSIDLNWIKPPYERSLKSEVPRPKEDNKSCAKELRKQAKQLLREQSNAPPFDEDTLEILPLGKSRRQNSSYTGDVFDPVIGDHRPESPPALLIMV